MNYLSLSYCLILIICGFGFPIAELTADSLENNYYQVQLMNASRSTLKEERVHVKFKWGFFLGLLHLPVWNRPSLYDILLHVPGNAHPQASRDGEIFPQMETQYQQAEFPWTVQLHPRPNGSSASHLHQRCQSVQFLPPHGELESLTVIQPAYESTAMCHWGVILGRSLLRTGFNGILRLWVRSVFRVPGRLEMSQRQCFRCTGLSLLLHVRAAVFPIPQHSGKIGVFIICPIYYFI